MYMSKTSCFSFPSVYVRSPEDEAGRCSSLVELLEQESQSEVFVEGISYALFKVAERGLVYAAKILLRYGADINFEGEFVCFFHSFLLVLAFSCVIEHLIKSFAKKRKNVLLKLNLCSRSDSGCWLGFVLFMKYVQYSQWELFT